MKKVVGPVLLVVFVLGVIAALFFSVREQFEAKSVVTIRGLIGSEKEAFFKDPRVVEALLKARLNVQIEKAGSREIADKLKAGSYDFASPSGLPAAEKIRRDTSINVVGSSEVFFTPMVIASWKSIADILVANGIARAEGNYYMLDMDAFFDTFASEQRWTDLSDSSAYDVNKRVMISSTDVRTSNSAAMYLALASYVAQGNNIVQNIADVDDKTMGLLIDLFKAQGFQASSSAVPFNDYLTMGVGKAPMVMVYESQFIYQAATDGSLKPDMVLMYPEPTLYTKHFIIGLNESGDLLGKLLRNDPELQNDPDLQQAAAELQKLEIEHGFRNSDTAYFQQFTQQHGLAVADSLVNVVDPPAYEVLEAMIQRIEQTF